MTVHSLKHFESDSKMIHDAWEEYYGLMMYNSFIQEKEHADNHISCYVSYSELCKSSSCLDKYILEMPDATIEEGERCLKEACIYDNDHLEHHVRIINMPESCRVPIKDISSRDIGHMISTEGVVKKTGDTFARMMKGAFLCSRCGQIIYEKQEDEQALPAECYKEQDGCGCSFRTAKFKTINDLSTYRDVRKVEIQESPDAVRSRAQPASFSAYVWDDLVNTIEVGDKVTLNGVVKCV